MNVTKSCNDRQGGTIALEAAIEVGVVIESGPKRTMRRELAMTMTREKHPYADDKGVRVPLLKIRRAARPKKAKSITAAKVIEGGEAMFLPVRWIQIAYLIGRRRVDVRQHLAGKRKSADRIAKVWHRSTVIPNMQQQRMARIARSFPTILWRRIWPKMILQVPHNLKSKLKQVEHHRLNLTISAVDKINVIMYYF